MREAVTNTSPLLYLHRLGKLDLLGKLYARVLVPGSVVEELAAGKAGGHDVPDVAPHRWAQIASSQNLSLLALASDLGKGEAEAIAIAHEQPKSPGPRNARAPPLPSDSISVRVA